MVAAKAFPLAPPISRNQLDSLRLKLRKTVPAFGLGAHLHRCMGQSLEFREYRDYNFGDDIRSVDWAASARRGGPTEYVTKCFEAEQKRTLVLLFDCRPAMRLPAQVPKLGVAAWIATCLVEMAQREGDKVVFAPVFASTKSEGGVARFDASHGRNAVAKMRKALATYFEESISSVAWNEQPTAGVRALPKALMPASAVVLITDALFDDPDDELAKFAKAAQRSFRTFHVIEIDSWPHEKAVLEAQPFRLLPLAGRMFPNNLSEASVAFLQEADAKLAGRRQEVRRRCAGPGLVWPAEALQYPATAEFDVADAQTWFANTFPQARFLHCLLSRAV